MRPSGSENTMKEYVSNEAGDRFATAKTTLAEPVRVEILSVETLKDLKKPAIQEILDYENGEEIRASYRYLEPMKKNEIPGYTEKSCRVFAYDSGMKPAMAGWTLVGGDGIVVLNVYFDAEGQAERYEAALQTGTGSVRKSWSAAADGTLINLDERKIEDPESVSVYDWDQVFFE